MATKDELVAYGEANGVAVDASMLKVDIEQALRDAGHDPDTLQPTGGDMADEPATTTSTDPAPAEDEEPRVSADARHSTYTEADVDTDERPPPGRVVIQEPGVPTEDA